MRSELASNPLASLAPRSIPHFEAVAVFLDGSGVSAEGAEDRERIVRQRLVNELTTGFRHAVEALCQLLGLLLRGGADDHITVSANNAQSLGLELFRELFGLLGRAGVDADLPGGEAVLEHFMLRLVALRLLVVPSVLVREPVLDLAHSAFDVVLAQLGLDDLPRPVGLGPRARVDEQRLVVARNGEPASLEILRQLAGLGAEVEAQPFEQPVGMRVLEVDPDAPVVVHEPILAEMPTASRCLVIPPSQNGKPAPRSSAVSTSFVLGTTPSARTWSISSAMASSAVSRICSGGSGSCSTTTISSRPAA